MGIVNGIANAMGIVVPMVVALMVDGNVGLRYFSMDTFNIIFILKNKNFIFPCKVTFLAVCENTRLNKAE